jgi:hypothetical protein
MNRESQILFTDIDGWLFRTDKEFWWQQLKTDLQKIFV